MLRPGHAVYTSTDLHRPPQTSTGLYRPPQASTGLHRPPQASTDLHRPLQTSTGLYRLPSDPPHHVPDVVGQPVDDGVTAAHELQVFGLRGFLRDQEHHEAGRHKGHGHDDEDGNHYIGTLEPGGERREERKERGVREEKQRKQRGEKRRGGERGVREKKERGGERRGRREE